MPLAIPAFDQYQAPLVPLRGLWNATPAEGDRYVNVEVDWLVTTRSSAVQFSLSGNSPVALSQIVALAVDNSRCGADIDCIFPDSGFVLTVPAHTQLVSPVFTNALMFYISAPNAAAGDVTVAQILNSMPPPVPIPGAEAQNSVSPAGLPVTNGTTQVVPASVSGTLNSVAGQVSVISGATQAFMNVSLVDGTGKLLAFFNCSGLANTTVINPLNAGGLSVRFKGGISVVVSGSTATGGMSLNLYYTTP
jgi:hypothetical protein